MGKFMMMSENDKDSFFSEVDFLLHKKSKENLTHEYAQGIFELIQTLGIWNDWCDWVEERYPDEPDESDIPEDIKAFTAIDDGAEWVHEWDDYCDWYYCSNCGYGDEGEVDENHLSEHCPACGALMIGTRDITMDELRNR